MKHPSQNRPGDKLTYDVLYKLYHKEGRSILGICRELNVSTVTLTKYMNLAGIKRRPFSTKGMKTRLGAILSEETKEKIRQAHLGKKIPPEVRKKMGSKGSKNPGWIDGRTPRNRLARHTAEYHLWREAVFERDNFTCQLCGKRGGNMNADHIKPFARFPELRTSIENGRTLCEPCHRQTDTFGYKAKNN